MRRTLVGVVALVLVAGMASGQAGKKKATDQELLQGTWQVTEFKAGRQSAVANALPLVVAAVRSMVTRGASVNGSTPAR